MVISRAEGAHGRRGPQGDRKQSPPSQSSAAAAMASRRSRRSVLTTSLAFQRSALSMVIDTLASALVAQKWYLSMRSSVSSESVFSSSAISGSGWVENIAMLGLAFALARSTRASAASLASFRVSKTSTFLPGSPLMRRAVWLTGSL